MHTNMFKGSAGCTEGGGITSAQDWGKQEEVILNLSFEGLIGRVQIGQASAEMAGGCSRDGGWKWEGRRLARQAGPGHSSLGCQAKEASLIPKAKGIKLDVVTQRNESILLLF